jgi:hypothetical protein
MFDRFTERARKVMQLSNHEALRRWHEQIGTEHMLLGLIREEHGLAASALKAMGVGLEAAQREVDRVSPPGPQEPASTKLPPSTAAKKAVVNALEEVRRTKAPNVDTEHLLLGLMRVPDSKSTHVLESMGVSLDALRNQIDQILTHDAQDAALNVSDDDDMSDDYDISRATVKRIKPKESKEEKEQKERAAKEAAEKEAAEKAEAERAAAEKAKPAPQPSNGAAPAVLAADMEAPVAPAGRGPRDSAYDLAGNGPGMAPAAFTTPMATGLTPRILHGPGAADNALRQALAMCWAILPDNRKTVAEAEAELRRLVERALRDLREDAQSFGMQ